MVYQWKSGARVKADPQPVGERLERLRERHGGFLVAEQIVSDARSERSPLHPCFEWNDKRAAEAYRVEQAEYLMRSIVVTVAAEESGEPVTVRAFVSVKPDVRPAGAYTSIQHAMESPHLREQVLMQARRELAQWRQRYREYAELADVFRAADQLLLAS
jgi:hypothetical protein